MFVRVALRVTWLVGALVSVAWAAGPLPDVGAFGGDARAGGFAQVLEPRVFEFPRDHGAHPEYRQEWWYVTGNLDSATGERFGFELTIFRFALAPEGVLRAGGVESDFDFGRRRGRVSGGDARDGVVRRDDRLRVLRRPREDGGIPA